jgi:hypothetical protein
VALSKLDSKYVRLEETMEDETRSHVCTIVSDGKELRPNEATVWGFGTSDGGQVRPVIAKACKKTDSVAHKQTK